MKKQNSNLSKKRLYCKTIYSLNYPVDYADNIEKKRDKKWFLRIRRLEKKSQQLREQMELLVKRHSLRVMETQHRVLITEDISSQVRQKTAARKEFRADW